MTVEARSDVHGEKDNICAIVVRPITIFTYINTKLSVCLYTYFSSISKPIVIPFGFGTKLRFALGKVLKQKYFYMRFLLIRY